jgi:hypothetical protein
MGTVIEGVEQARVSSDAARERQSFLPLAGFHDARPVPTPADVCAAVGLNWLSAVHLHEAGWLSFSPKLVPALDPAQEAELRFLGVLVAAGCDDGVLRLVLSGLKKPYAYRVDRMYYDWHARSWDLLPTRLELREMFAKWLDDLVEAGQRDMLEDLRDNVNIAIREIRANALW